MKTVFAIRHAKSSWSELSLSDHDRLLNRRGLADAPRMGEALAQRDVQPDAILSSTAVRALTTAKMIAAALDFPEEKIVADKKWYLASSRVWLKSIRELDEDFNTVCIFGHNPGMHDFSERVLRSGEIDHFPTLGTAHLEFDIEFWGNADWKTARLAEFLYPKGL